MKENETPHVEYPCSWPFKVIGSDADLIQAEIRHLLQDRDGTLAVSAQSKQGTYTSFSLSVHITSELDRNTVYGTLRQIPSVKIVL